jgi:hypothetical protein
MNYILKHYNGLFARDILEGMITLTRDAGDAHIFDTYKDINDLITERNMTSFEICKQINIDSIFNK